MAARPKDVQLEARIGVLKALRPASVGQECRRLRCYVNREGAQAGARRIEDEDFRVGCRFKRKIEWERDRDIRLGGAACTGWVHSELKSRTGGAKGGARPGRPRHSSIFCVVSGGWMAARIFIAPPHRSHSRTSTRNTLIIKRAQA